MARRKWMALALGGALAYAYWQRIYRYRDPVRLAPPADADGGAVLAPVDAAVMFVRRAEAGGVTDPAGTGHSPRFGVAELGWPADWSGWVLGLYLGPLDARYVYAPGDLQLESICRVPGRPTLPLLEHRHPQFDLLTLRLSPAAPQPGETPQDVCLTVADPRRLAVLTYLQPGDRVAAGRKLAFAEQGAWVILGLPADWLPSVQVGEHVTGGVTALARRSGA